MPPRAPGDHRDGHRLGRLRRRQVAAVGVSAGTPMSTSESTPTTVAVATSSPPTTSEVAPGTSTTVGPPATTTSSPATTRNPPTTTSGQSARRAPITTSVPTSASVTVPGTTSTTAGTIPTVASTTSTTAPLAAPVLLDARQGFGTPCEPASTRNPPGCFFFVYATTATTGSFHRIYSDAAFGTEPLGASCGTQSPHHGGEDTCSWYPGPVYGRTSAQQECFWATTVSGGRQSEPSNLVCLTWTNQAT